MNTSDRHDRKIDITVVLNAHREGYLVAQSLRSARAALTEALNACISAEIIVVLDCPDEVTRNVVEAAIQPAERVIVLNFEDLSRARNAGVEAALGRTVAFLDGDDLFGSAWLRQAFAILKDFSFQDVVLHPQLSVLFGEEMAIWEHIGMENPDYRMENMIFENYFTSLAMTTADVLKRFPYRSISFHGGFGYEDWSWNCETSYHGVRHFVVPETLHAIRRRPSSLLGKSRASCLLRIPTPVLGSTPLSE